MSIFGRGIYYRNTGLLVLRLGIGISFALYHGWPKIVGGEETWLWLGEQMKYIGFSFWPIFWGFCAAAVEFGSAILIAIGFFTKWNSMLLAFVMLIAIIYHVSTGSGLGDATHALESMMAFIALFLTGPGKYSVDNYLSR